MACHVVLASVIALSLLSGPARELQKTNPPTRLAVLISQRSLNAGQSLKVTLELRDAYNVPTAAQKAYSLNLELWLDNTLVNRRPVALARGASSLVVQLTMDKPGIFMVKATHAELREDSAYVRVFRRTADAIPRGTALLRLSALKAEAFREPVFPAFPPASVDLDLRYSDTGGKPSANGTDRVRITAFLSAELARPVDLKFYNSGGTLEPNPLKLSAGALDGETYLTSEKAEQILIEFRGAQPPDTVRLLSGGKHLTEFSEACKEIALWSSPRKIPLGASAQIVMTFLGLHGEQLESCNGSTEVTLMLLKDGLGYFNPPNPVKMQDRAHGGAGVAEFTPQSAERIAISARTFGAISREAVPVEVYFPYSTLLVVFFLSFVTTLIRSFHRGAKRKRVIGAVLGGLTAVVVVGFAQFGLAKVVSPQVALNPYGAAVVAVAVGLGTVSIQTLRVKPE